MAFPDDFDRADGPLGSDWSVASGACAIVDGAAVASAESFVLCAAQTEAGAQDHYIVIPKVGGEYFRTGLIVKSDATAANFYFVEVESLSGTLTITRGWRYNSGWGGTATATMATPAGDTLELRVTYSSGVTTGYVNGVSQITLSDADYASQAYFGFYIAGNTGTVNAFDSSDVPEASLNITPDPLYVGGGLVLVTATLTGETWDPENPADTTFTVDHGTIDAQAITSETTATLYYTPADYLGTITFTESKFSLSDTVDATVIPPEGEGEGACPFDAEFIEVANNTEPHYSGDALMTEGTLVSATEAPELNISVVQAIAEIWAGMYHWGHLHPPEGATDRLSILWELVNDGNEPGMGPFDTPSGIPLMHQLDEVRTSLADLRTGAEWDLSDLALVLGGSPVKSHADILNAIGSSVDYSDVIDAISQLRGNNVATLAATFTQIAQIRTGGLYTLGDVLEAISGLGSGISVDLGPIMTKLRTIQPNEAYDLTSLTSLLVNLGNVAAAISNSLTAYRTPSAYTVQHILDAILAARTAIIAAVERRRVPPIWPGAELVTFGESYDLSTTAVITAPMDGVLVNITGTDPGTSFFQYQGMRAWRHIGGLTFFQEGGYCETHQALGFASAIYSPKEMVRASGVRLFLGHGPQGTIRPWTIN